MAKPLSAGRPPEPSEEFNSDDLFELDYVRDDDEEVGSSFVAQVPFETGSQKLKRHALKIFGVPRGA